MLRRGPCRLSRDRLFEVFGREDRVCDRDAVVERQTAHARAGFVRDQLEVIGLAADDAAQRNQRVIAVALGQRLQRDGHFERAGHAHVVDVGLGDAQRGEFAEAGVGERIGDVFIEACLHDADAQPLAVEFG